MEYLIHDHFSAITGVIRGLNRRQNLELDELHKLAELRRTVWGIGDSIIIVEGLTDNKANPADNKTVLAWVALRPSFEGYRREWNAFEFLVKILGAELQLESIERDKQRYPSLVPSYLQNLFRKPFTSPLTAILARAADLPLPSLEPSLELFCIDAPIGNDWLPELPDPRWQTDPMLQEWYPKMPPAQISDLARDYLGKRIDTLLTQTPTTNAPTIVAQSPAPTAAPQMTRWTRDQKIAIAGIIVTLILGILALPFLQEPIRNFFNVATPTLTPTLVFPTPTP